MTQREAFEKWFISGYGRLGRVIGLRNGPGNYADSHTHAAWEAWQAATRHAAKLALVAPVKTCRQDQREACANWILGGLE